MSQPILNTGSFLYLLGQLGPFTDPDAGSGASGSGGAVITGSFADPNGNVTPAMPTNGAWYYKDGQTLVWWQWSVNDQVWYQGSG